MRLELEVALPRRDFLLEVRCDIPDGCTAVYGPSGAGKTSLFNLIAGLERPARGRIVLDGRVLTDAAAGVHIPPHRRRMGVVFQDLRLFPHMTVRENLAFGIRYAAGNGPTPDGTADLLDLTPLLDARPGEISGGERQRTAIGRALLTNPALLLLDEPFSAVDTARRRQILPYLRRLRDERDLPLLVISHDMPDLQRLADRFLLLDRGRQQGFGPLDELDYDGEERLNVLALHRPEPAGEGTWRYAVEGLDDVFVKTPWGEPPHLHAVLRPDEIVLSRRRVPDLSIRNQVPGRITSIRRRGAAVFCEVDAGLALRAEITPDALESLGLSEGDEVFCLFKAHSVKV